MFITEQGSNRFLYLSGLNSFEIEIVSFRDKEVHIYFKDSLGNDERRQRYGCYKTEQRAKEVLQRFMQAFVNKEKKFVFINEC